MINSSESDFKGPSKNLGCGVAFQIGTLKEKGGWRSLLYFYQGELCDVQHTLVEVLFILLILYLALISVATLPVTQNCASVNDVRYLRCIGVSRKKIWKESISATVYAVLLKTGGYMGYRNDQDPLSGPASGQHRAVYVQSTASQICVVSCKCIL